jgi:nitrate reductase gamma subunit
MSPTLLHLITYACILVLILAVLIKSLKILSLPLHLRWELYPVAHEGKKASYGGSFMEDLDWWTKQRHSSLLGELKVMIPEILLLKALWESNRSHWVSSFPFHFGLYVLILTAVLMILGAALSLAGVDMSAGAGGIGGILNAVTGPVGVIGLILATLGTLGLLLRRLSRFDLVHYTSPADIFNLLFFLAALAVGLYVAFLTSNGATATRDYIQSLIVFDLGAPTAGASVTVMVLLFSLLAAYVPLTHMSHFFTKYFMYHHIRWDDTPNVGPGKIEDKVKEYLNYKVTWDAPHIKGGGTKTWVDVALENPAQEETEEK